MPIRCRSPHRAVVLAALLTSSAATAEPGATAEPDSSAPSAEALFREGRDAVKMGEYEIACPKFEESQRLDPANGTLLNLALCEEGWGHLADARRHFRQVLEA